MDQVTPLNTGAVRDAPDAGSLVTGARVLPFETGQPADSGQRLLVIAEVARESELVTSYWLASPDGAALPAPAAGQYLPVSVDVPDHGMLRRSYTISAYVAGRYRLSIKRECRHGHPPGQVSNYIHDNWAAGDLIHAGAPQGRFVLDATNNRPIVLIAGGIGITPLLAMLHELAAQQSTRNVVLFMGMRHHLDHPFRSEVADVAHRMPNLTVHVRYSDAAADAGDGPVPDSYGLIDEALLRDLAPLPDADIYLCGPAPFMKAMDLALASLGVPDERIRFEAFGPATIERGNSRARDGAAALGPMVSFNRSNVAAPFDPRALNLLEFAEDLGLNPSFNCRSGSCGACATRKLSGATRYVGTPTAVVADDEILLCCALPDEPVSLEL
ncbi:MAG: hypothetical protein COW30_03200 [Rhodospirillales bacterium CG15_BIG_FIL_POST_REV_8_21_14_020_66_15]|nr:MAG: hypothetical protein COW30_03200 [Rhodospirillales bacterium CG15_BIG_FIL_POST_REV_8_21_14_020_66_15]